MTVDRWKDVVLADVRRRGLDELVPMIDTLGGAITAVRAGDWNEAPWDPVPGPDADRTPTVAATETVGGGPADDARPERLPSHAPAALSILHLARELGAGRTSSRAVTEACLERIAQQNADLNAFITVTADTARAQAAEADACFARGEIRSPLQGIPISVKDLIAVAGVPTTAASLMRRGAVAPADAQVVSRLKASGAVIVGTCNLHEFAYGTTSEDSAYGPARHPFDRNRSPGGSSGGSAAAVRVGMCAASIGTDTGGSVRIPSAACGVVGLKPAYGELPCHGVVPLARGLDHVGPIASTVVDAWLLYSVMRGSAPTSWPPDAPQIDASLLRLGVPRPYFLDLLDPDVRDQFEDGLARLRGAGARVVEVAVPHAADIAPVYLLTVFAEAAAYHGPGLETHPDRYTVPVRSRLELSRYVLAEDYVRAQVGRTRLRQEVDAVLDTCHALVLPTLPIIAPPIGAAAVPVGSGRIPVRAATLRLTQLFNLTGHPAISIPGRPTRGGWPTGLQLVGPADGTARLLGIARIAEAVVGA